MARHGDREDAKSLQDAPLHQRVPRRGLQHQKRAGTRVQKELTAQCITGDSAMSSTKKERTSKLVHVQAGQGPAAAAKQPHGPPHTTQYQ